MIKEGQMETLHWLNARQLYILYHAKPESPHFIRRISARPTARDFKAPVAAPSNQVTVWVRRRGERKGRETVEETWVSKCFLARDKNLQSETRPVLFTGPPQAVAVLSWSRLTHPQAMMTSRANCVCPLHRG